MIHELKRWLDKPNRERINHIHIESHDDMIMQIGKYRGKTFAEIAKIDPVYCATVIKEQPIYCNFRCYLVKKLAQ